MVNYVGLQLGNIFAHHIEPVTIMESRSAASQVFCVRQKISNLRFEFARISGFDFGFVFGRSNIFWTHKENLFLLPRRERNDNLSYPKIQNQNLSANPIRKIGRPNLQAKRGAQGEDEQPSTAPGPNEDSASAACRLKEMWEVEPESW